MLFSLDGVSYDARTLMRRFFYGCIGVLFFYFPASAHAQIKNYVGPYKYYISTKNIFSDEAPAWDLRLAEANKNAACPYAWGAGSAWAHRSSIGGIVSSEGKTRSLDPGFMNVEGKCVRKAGYGEEMMRSRLVCLEIHNLRYYPPTDKCESGEFFENQGANGGNVGQNCKGCVGQPITPVNGNMWHAITDYQAPKSSSDLTLERIYNSSLTLTDPFSVRGFGVRWTHSYNKSLKAEEPRSEQTMYKCWKFTFGLVDCSFYVDNVNPIPQQMAIKSSDGKRFVFTRDTSGAYKSTADVSDKLSAVMSPDNLAVQEWVLYNAKNDSTERFDKSGLLLSITERTGLTKKLTYSDGVSNDTAVSRFPASAPECANAHPGAVLPARRLLCVTNHWGLQLQFRYDAGGRVGEMIDPAKQSYLYEYDGPSGGCVPGNEKTVACRANNLTKVIYPDGKSQTYFYNEASKINNGKACDLRWAVIGNGFGHEVFSNMMTGLVDENDQRHINWTYDCGGRATSSQLGEGIEKVTVAYVDGKDTPATVTHYVGPAENVRTTERTYSKKYMLGIAQLTAISAPCVECGTIAERVYDTTGNVTMTKDFNSNYSCFAYDTARNLETTRIEGVSTATCTSLLSAQTLALPMRKTTTKWHAQFTQPEAIAEPKRVTKYEYDASGNVLTKTEQATTDLTGAQGLNAPLTGSARKWAYTYNNVGQLHTVTGPRTDIVDLTKYDYDALTGYLVKVTNAAKQETTFSDYDGHGHVRTIRAPNGVTTTLSYTPRGWVASQAVSNGTTTQTTTYDYTPSGEVRTVTFPDNSVTTYTYDVAHRLTSVANNRGESIVYTLDLTGNRIKEEVRDPKGNLARQITRTYDTIGRLTSQTGAAQ
ncbi:hypothetical protein F2P44_23420 [Massilia sp. CCM 8695]|uniref:DUF6531 domain-containing protein n=1 Tax=Massilia frigida TaxID=2609281 RepID=A0ABX0NIB4_9BURK|nr:DUF6531 domain-containing protein [Massilia frigida]NHZ82205.1 hypothetical protein [Massilia frigida]